jgi:hypothetical protein
MMEKAALPLYAQDRMPYVLKEAGPVRMFAVRIGGILAELWEYQRSNTAPYVRLVKEVEEPPGKMKAIREAKHQAVLSPMETLVVMGAIEKWETLWTAGFRSKKSPCTLVQVDRLILKLYNPTRRQSAYAEVTFAGTEAMVHPVVLSPTEASLLAGTLAQSLPTVIVGMESEGKGS